MLATAMSESAQGRIPLAMPHLSGCELDYVREAIESNWVSTAGPFVERFEEAVAEAAGARRAVATVSGTAALHVALIVAGVQPDEEVVVPALSFVAPANAIRYCGAWPVFVDVHETDWQLDIEMLAGFLESDCERRGGGLFNRRTGRRIAALLPVHLLGGMFDVDALCALAADYGLPVVEDAAECLGATWRGRPIGAPLPQAGAPRLIVTSFNGNKIVTTGGGGAILCNDDSLADRALHLTTNAKRPGPGYFHDEIGFNYRLPSLAAALGLAQIERLNPHVDSKRRIAALYEGAFQHDARITQHPEPNGCRSIFWLYTVLTDRNVDTLISALDAVGIQSRSLWTPLPHLPAFDGCQVIACDVAEHLGRHGLCLPCGVGLPDEDVRRTTRSLLELLDRREVA